ncbi:MAG: type I-C CRISPR-associated protein Cas5c [Candidatus Limiplasma sp.]|nr:type I-C CRISPR-associated protein Cas5c [Candidatus Limiplasma sp.]
MEHQNAIAVLLTGRFALFSDPVTRVGGEKTSYLVPTYEALKGVCESIYWKPTFQWYVDSVRVINPFQSQSKGMRPISLREGPATLSIYTYLQDVRYEVRAHFEWNPLRADLMADRNEHKHFFMAQRSLERGGRRDIFLGTRECQGYVEPLPDAPLHGAFDSLERMTFGNMFHGFDYGDTGSGGQMAARFFEPEMLRGVITFPRPEMCTVRRAVKPLEGKSFVLGETLRPVEEESL